MNQYARYALAALLGILIGYFAGREHLKYEMRTAFESAAEGISESLSTAFGGDSRTDEELETMGDDGSWNKNVEEPAIAAYISDHIELYDASVKYINSMLDGEVPGVKFKIRNAGDRSLDKVEVTFYFKNAQGNIIAEEDYHPVLVTEYSFSGDNKPLKPGYIWQMEQGKFYTAKQVPSEWKEGSFEASITDIRFTE